MMTLISQMVGCLLIAAGIGFGVGWWLRQVPKPSPQRPTHELAGVLQTKELALDTMVHDLKAKTSAVQILEQKIMAAETLHSSAQRDLIVRNDRIKALETELATRSKQLTSSEADAAAVRRRVSEMESMLATQTHELRETQQTSRNAEQAREVMEREVSVLRDRIAQLNEGLADRDRLRAQLQTLESAQNRVHQLEIELSDREAAHRGTIQQFERSLAERDQQIGEFDSMAATQREERQEAQQARRTAEQAREVLEQEIRLQRDHIAQLNEGLADRDRLRTQVKQFEAVQDRVHQLEVELSNREAAHRSTIQQFERSLAERDQRIGEFDLMATTQREELQEAQQACRTAEQAREVLEQEIRLQRDRIVQLNEGLADRDQIRARMAKLESVQDRVHQLEVELSDREATHRAAVRELEQIIAERDHRIDELVPVTHLLREKETELKEWGKKYQRTVREHEGEVAKLQEQCATQEQLHAQHLLDAQHLQERDEQIARLNQQLSDSQTERQTLFQEVQSIPEKDEQIDRLQKRLKDMRAALRTPPSSALSTPRQARQNETTSPTQVGQPKASRESQEDDLKKIYGIGPVFAQTLNKMGTHRFIQIARWKPEDIAKIAKKLDTDPERIKRENWIADAKKHHYRKYGERL
jgi:predicted flap endonuclease-1-like 5' DNA nuclease